MLGAIIGDIAGSCYEFDNTSDYSFPFFSPEKDFTDDTICTIAVADAILNGKSYQEALLEWCRRYPDPMGAYGGSFSQWIMSRDPKPYNSFGNGAAMRASPAAWLFDSEERVRKEAEASAAVTHSHPEGIRGAVATATAIFRLRRNPAGAHSVIESVAKEFYGRNFRDMIPPRGYFDVTCQGCVPLSLHIVSQASDFEDAVRRAVAYGGDTDTVGAITGSIAEAAFGIPPEMTAKAKEYLPQEMLYVIRRFDEKRDSI